MRLNSFVVKNFRRLKNVRVDLAEKTTIFVGANNTGKTSATHIFQLFLQERPRFKIYDFSVDCWNGFEEPDLGDGSDVPDFPIITLDLWFGVESNNLHRVVDLLPDLGWQDTLVGMRLAYQPKDASQLYTNYSKAREAASVRKNSEGVGAGDYKPWPRNMYDYLVKRLDSEYGVYYYKLDRRQFNQNFEPEPGCEPDLIEGGARILQSILRVDFLDAQRYLTDAEVKGRAEDLSKRMARFYQRNLDQRQHDQDSLDAIARSENLMNGHYADVFKDPITQLGKLGYPGLRNPSLMIRARLNPDLLLHGSTQVHYAIPGMAAGNAGILPDRYNGLGFKNLIYMAFEILDFHKAWEKCDGVRPPVHVVMIEEPESHLHVQLQQVFVRQVQKMVGEKGADFQTQFILTTHSPHVAYEDFSSIRYFCRIEPEEGLHHTEVKDLGNFCDSNTGEERVTRDFLRKYLKITHCDLFFADAAVLVEGNVERLLLPLIIEEACEGLKSCHLTILEVGGAFAHKFRKLIEFLGMPCLIITDLDSVVAITGEEKGVEGKRSRKTACLVDAPQAVTSNETLKQWVPGRESIADLLDCEPKAKSIEADRPNGAAVRVAYQTRVAASWKGETREVAGRTFEEAFALQNLEWSQSPENSSLGLRVVSDGNPEDFDQVREALFDRVGKLDKTKFALELMAAGGGWVPPFYVVEGLGWLAEQLGVAVNHAGPSVSGHQE